MDTPEEMIATFAAEIVAGLTVDEYERREDNGSLEATWSDADVAALYLARFWHLKSPWWADEAFRRLSNDGLPVTKVMENTQLQAADLRLSGGGETRRQFQRRQWEDVTFFRLAAMRKSGVSVDRAASEAARWRDQMSDGKFTVKASTIDTGFPKWAADPLGGAIWMKQLSRMLIGLSATERADLIQCYKLLIESFPNPLRGIIGKRR